MFTDIEGSTRLLASLGEGYTEVLTEHRRLLREAFQMFGGVEVDTEGDSFFVAFETAEAAVSAAQHAQEALAGGPVRVRMGLHTGHPSVVDANYVGMDVHRAARIAACGHGGQVLLSQSTRSLVDVAVRDLGMHWLKDLPAAEHLYQIGAVDFGPLKSLHPTNLPVESAPFLGRERELTDLVALLSRPGTRLVSLTGPGGSGKTRLALQAAKRLLPSYIDGVWFIGLAAVTDPDLVPAAIGTTLGVRESATDDYRKALASHLATRRLLLVLDNLEQLLPGVAGIVAALASAAPDVDILVTSRERLRLSAESEFGVDSLSPDEATEFFLDRAGRSGTALPVDAATRLMVMQICERLDRLPLAIELAAPRTRVLSLPALLARLDNRLALLVHGPRDLPARQQTLRETIAWSYDLLDPDAQRLMARLAVFAGGCEFEAAEAVASADLDVVASLIDHNLLRRQENARGDVRLMMLETIREYAAERLEISREAESMRQAHARYFADWTAERNKDLFRGQQEQALPRLADDHDNLRAALRFCLDAGQAPLALRLAASSWMFWYMQGHVSEGRAWLDAALQATQDIPGEDRATALDGAGFLASEQAEHDVAEDLLRRSVECAKQAGASRAAALAMTHLSVQLPAAEALTLGEEARALADIADDPFVKSITLNNLGEAFRAVGDPLAAMARYQESFIIRRRHGDLMGAALSLINLGEMALIAADTVSARQSLTEALEISRRLGNSRHVCFALDDLGWADLADGRLDDAGSNFRDALVLARDLGSRYFALDIILGLAGVVAAQGDATRAAQLSAAAEAHLKTMKGAPAVMDAGIHLPHLDNARRAAGDAVWARAREESAGWTFDQLVDVALRDG